MGKSVGKDWWVQECAASIDVHVGRPEMDPRRSAWLFEKLLDKIMFGRFSRFEHFGGASQWLNPPKCSNTFKFKP